MSDMSENTIYLSQEKKTELEQELAYLKAEVRPEIVARLQYAKSLGDLSENAEYHSAREEQGKNEDRIKELEYTLKYAQIIEKKEGSVAEMTSVITVQKEGEKESRVYTLVGAREADMASGKVSIESPIGSAFLGKSAGDTVKITTPGGTSTWKIITIS